MSLRLSAIIEYLGGTLVGDSQIEILALAPLETATSSDLSFLSHSRYASLLVASKAGCVIVSPSMQTAATARGSCIVTDDPYLYFARLTQLWKRVHAASSSSPASGAKLRIHPSAVVDPAAWVDPRAVVGPLCVIEAGAKIGVDTVLKSRVTVSENCIVGAQAMVPMNMQVPDGSLVLGVPAKVVRQLSEKDFSFIVQSALNYQKLGHEYRGILTPAERKSSASEMTSVLASSPCSMKPTDPAAD